MNHQFNDVNIEMASSIITGVIKNAFTTGVTPPTMNILGAAGVGKSSIVNNLPETLTTDTEGNETIIVTDDGRKYRREDIVVIDLRLSGMEHSDVLGLPFVLGDEAPFSTPSWFPSDDRKLYILFLDELTNSSISTQHAAYRLILDRSIQNGKTMGSNVAIIAAGNRVEDKTGAKALVPALANRFAMHLNIVDFAEPTLNYMTRNNFDQYLIAMLESDKSLIHKIPDSKNVTAFPTPRSWEAANEHMKNPFLNRDENMLRVAVAGAVGSEATTEYFAFREYGKFLPNWGDVKRGVKYTIPEDQGDGIKLIVSIGLSFELMACATCLKKQSEHSDEIENLLKILDDLGHEHWTVTFRNMKRHPKAMLVLNTNKQINQYFKVISSRLK